MPPVRRKHLKVYYPKLADFSYQSPLLPTKNSTHLGIKNRPQEASYTIS
jgi:hypothetical protein